MKNIIRLLLIGCALIIIFSTYTLYAYDEKIIHGNEEAIFNRDELITILNSKSINELISDMSLMGDETNSWDQEKRLKFAVYSEVLEDKIPNSSGEYITEEIMNPNNSVQVKVLLLQKGSLANTELDYKRIATLLDYENIDYSIKYQILIVLRDNSKDVTTLEKVAVGNNERLAFHALEFLYELLPLKATELSIYFLENCNGTIGFKERGAIRVISWSLENSSKEDINKFITFCDKILNDEIADDQLVVDGIAITLSRMYREDCINYILSSDIFDSSIKIYCVRMNRPLLGQIFGDSNLDGNVDAKDALEVLRNAAKIDEFNAYQKYVCDVDYNYIINASDALMILKYSTRMIDMFPADPGETK